MSAEIKESKKKKDKKNKKHKRKLESGSTAAAQEATEPGEGDPAAQQDGSAAEGWLPDADESLNKGKISTRLYQRTLANLQVELVKLQNWIVRDRLKVVILFEGRDAAGKGGTIKRITECLNPRVARVVALPARPSGKRPSGTSSVTWPICRPPARSSSSTAAGTTERASSA